jgi:putative iron-regulated protein
MMQRLLLAAGTGLAMIAAQGTASGTDSGDRAGVVETYADIAQAMYQDALTGAQQLREAIGALVATPSDTTLDAARTAWLAARVPYQQTEVYRFGNPIVDDWEGKVNAWPLDEGLIDYVDASYGTESDVNLFYTANVIANPKLEFGGQTVDTSTITKELLADTLQEIDAVEANVATGYHAVEFLLWGQDLGGTGPGAGNRPASDFDPASCTGGNCERRVEYLRMATDLLVDDLAWMAGQWRPDGEARAGLLEGDPDEGLTTILTGLGSLSYGELAGERMKLGLMLHDPEEEHDCFSDNTHNSHYYDARGISNVYIGEYTRIDGSVVSGPSLSDLAAAKAPEVDKEMRAALETTLAAMRRLVDRAETTEAYDQMIGPDNPEGNAVVQAAIDALTAQTRSIERVVATLGLQPIQFEGSDSLDDPAAVLQ